MESGVSQRSSQGPILFTIYVRDTKITKCSMLFMQITPRWWIAQAHLAKIKSDSVPGVSRLIRGRCKRLRPLGRIMRCNKRLPSPEERSNGAARLSTLE
ncbi:hypothetical protein Trydic_g7659 [Trypoxylus dichotomus]